MSHSRRSSRSSLDEALQSQPRSKDSSASSTSGAGAKTKPVFDYCVYMASILPKQAVLSPTAASPVLLSPQSSPGADKKVAPPSHTILVFDSLAFCVLCSTVTSRLLID